MVLFLGARIVTSNTGSLTRSVLLITEKNISKIIKIISLSIKNNITKLIKRLFAKGFGSGKRITGIILISATESAGIKTHYTS